MEKLWLLTKDVLVYKTRYTYLIDKKELGGENKLHIIRLAPEDLPKIQNGARLHGKLDFASKLISLDEFPKSERVK